MLNLIKSLKIIMAIYEALFFLMVSTIVAIASSSDDMNEVDSEDPAHNSVYWIVETNPVIFGRNVTLRCITANVENICIKCPERWYGGKELSLLSYNGYPSKNTKFVPSTGHSGFGIIITQFDKKDLNVNYSCSFGPYFDKKNLTADMLNIKEESWDGESSEQLNIFLIAGIIIPIVLALVSTAVCLVMYLRLVIKKRRQHEERREHRSEEKLVKHVANVANSANAKRYHGYLVADKESIEKFSHQNSKDFYHQINF